LIEREEEITGDPEGDTGSVDSPRSPYHEGGNVDESPWHIQQEDEATPTETQQGEDEWVDDAQVVWEEGDHYQHLSSREGVRSGGEGRKMVQTTGVVHYRDRETGEEKSSNCRCLLDTGADVTFITEAWADRLGLDRLVTVETSVQEQASSRRPSALGRRGAKMRRSKVKRFCRYGESRCQSERSIHWSI
jgi:hypothetical protein